MKLIRKKEQDYDVLVYQKKYLQSYLKWLYNQNEDFNNYLTLDEIVNYFVKELTHPVWFQYLLYCNTFNVLADITAYFNEFKSEAAKFDSYLPIIVNKYYDGIQSVPAIENYGRRATDTQLSELEQLGIEFDEGETVYLIDYYIIKNIKK